MIRVEDFENCGAPLCPKDPKARLMTWYPDEEICLHRFNTPNWVKKQQKIKKIASWKNGYFTIETLKSLNRIKPGIKGSDPDKK